MKQYIPLITLTCLQLLSVCHAEMAADTEKSLALPNIIQYEPGVHELDEIKIDSGRVILEGAGFGVTILKIKNGVHIKTQDPVIRNLTIVGQGAGVGLRLSNTWRARIQDVGVENYQTGILLELTGEGREMAGGVTKQAWPSALDTDANWGSRVTLSEIRNVEISGPGDGIVLRNDLKTTDSKNYWLPTNDRRDGEFMNATTIWGGHIVVKGRSVVIGDGIGSTKIFGTYMDISPAGGIVMEYGARGLTVIGASLDLIRAAHKQDSPRIRAPLRAKDSIQLIANTPNDFKIEYTPNP